MERRIYDEAGHVFFITFSCYRRRKLLDTAGARDIVVACMGEELSKHGGRCAGFVIMPHHVHAAVWFEQPGDLSDFMKQWKRRSSVRVKETLRRILPRYAAKIDLAEAVWQRRYFAFNIFDEGKLREKIEYMHKNPVAGGLAKRPVDWGHSSARWYELGEPVGVKIELPGG